MDPVGEGIANSEDKRLRMQAIMGPECATTGKQSKGVGLGKISLLQIPPPGPIRACLISIRALAMPGPRSAHDVLFSFIGFFKLDKA